MSTITYYISLETKELFVIAQCLLDSCSAFVLLEGTD
jgi:hypothetical protein